MSTNVSELLAIIAELNETLVKSQSERAELAEECSGEPVVYDVGLHVMALFVTLVVSLAGAALPIASKHWEQLRVDAFVVAMGKCVGTGVVLAVAMIHMLVPSNESFSSPCLDPSVMESYPAYTFLLALFAALLMHLIDNVVEETIRHYFGIMAVTAVGCEGTVTTTLEDGGVVGYDEARALDGASPPDASACATSATAAAGDEKEVAGQTSLVVPHHFHSHAIPVSTAPSESFLHALVAAALMEFGVSIHSIFVGLAVGIVPNTEVRVLLTALVFHQFFEGMALGSRLAEATYRRVTEVVFAVVFAVSAPFGMMIGIVMMSTSGFNENGTTFLILQGVMDGICAGILMYLGFQLLVHDFMVDTERHAAKSGMRRWAMFGAMWTGAGVMAVIGKWL
jgi:zinc transporter 1/2/3